jgi:hypothetical protein
VREFHFTSAVDAAYRNALERLLFFNPGQGHVRSRIIDAVRRFGSPRILEKRGTLHVVVEASPDGQALFVLDKTSGVRPTLCGVILYTRQGLDEIFVQHIAIRPAYSMRGRYASDRLAMRMIEELCRIARRIKGVRFVTILYGRGPQKLRIENCGS